MDLIRRRALTGIATLLLLSSCSTTKVMSAWEADHGETDRRERIAVVAMIPEALQRLTVEQEIVRVLRKGGRNALISSDIPGLAGRLSRARAEPALKAASVDALVVVFFTRSGKGDRKESADYYTSEVNPDFFDRGYNWFVPQFANTNKVKRNSDFFTQKSYVYVETNYFDIIDDFSKWSMITRSKNLEYNNTSNSVAKEIVAKMKSTGTL